MDPKGLDKLGEIIKGIDGYLMERDSVREGAIKLTREIIRYSGWCVTAIHRGVMDEAQASLREAEDRVRRLQEALKPYPELYYSGLVYNALAEYVEAKLLLELVSGGEIQGPRELDVPPIPYLQGLGDLVGELRRLVLEYIRRGEYESAWSMFRVMEAIYLELRSLDYPDSLMPGVRHKADVARRLVDDTRAFIIDMESRRNLIDRLRTLE